MAGTKDDRTYVICFYHRQTCLNGYLATLYELVMSGAVIFNFSERN
jgi:hypothetical protein